MVPDPGMPSKDLLGKYHLVVNPIPYILIKPCLSVGEDPHFWYNFLNFSSILAFCLKVTSTSRPPAPQASTVRKLSDLPEGSSYYEEESVGETVEVDLDANETTENAKQKSAL